MSIGIGVVYFLCKYGWKDIMIVMSERGVVCSVCDVKIGRGCCDSDVNEGDEGDGDRFCYINRERVLVIVIVM